MSVTTDCLPMPLKESILEQAAAASEEKKRSLRLRFCSNSFHKIGRFPQNASAKLSLGCNGCPVQNDFNFHDCYS